MRRRLLLSASVVLALACSERPPPPGSGAIETTLTASAAAVATPAAVSPPRLVTYPGGAVLVLEPAACRIQALETGKQLWSRHLPACGGLLEAAIARDSTAFVRAGPELAAIEREGAERWRIKLDGGPPPRAIARPTTLADSRAVLAESPRSVAVYDADGRAAWRFSIPTEEVLIAPPEGLPTEGVALLTGTASYVLGADGELRGRAPLGRK